MGSAVEAVLGPLPSPDRVGERVTLEAPRDELLSAIVTRSPAGIGVLDAGGTIRFANAALCGMLGVECLEARGRDFFEFVHPDDEIRTRADVATVLARSEDQLITELRAGEHERSWPWLEMTLTNLVHDPTLSGILLNIRDVSVRRSVEDDLRHRVLHDTLTGVANRLLLLDRLRGALARSERDARTVTVSFLDLDNFKQVNDELGHECGDEVLVGVARRLLSNTRAEDTVARFGGDEFVVVVERDRLDTNVQAIAERVLAAFRQPVRAREHLVPVTASIGIAIAQDGEAEELLRTADAAMYQAKQNGGNQYVVLGEPIPSLSER